MPLLHFQRRFVQDVRYGRKRQTIRLERKRPIKPGDRLILGAWEGQPYRSKVERIDVAICRSVQAIEITNNGGIYINGRACGARRRGAIAKDDGFTCAYEMLEWFKENHGLPFCGVVIRW